MDSSLSIFSLIISAGFVVQVIMLVLVLMSIYSWTVIMSKKKTLMDASKDIKSFHNNFLADADLSILHGQIPDQVSNRSPMEHIFGAGYGVFTHTTSTSNQALVINSERAYRSMNTAVNNEVDRLDHGLSHRVLISAYLVRFGVLCIRLLDWPLLSRQLFQLLHLVLLRR